MSSLFFVLFLAFVASTTAQCPRYKTLIFTDSAKNAAGLTHTVNKFRAALGDPDNMSNVGPFAKGRREVRWT